MSQATASAKARRAFNSNNPAPTPSSSATQPNVNTQGLTLPQVISIIDSRLVNLETYVKEERSTPRSSDPSPNSDILNEFNHRTTLLAEEIASLKDIVLKLQSYTMEVNKTLYDERIHVLSDLGSESLLEVSENNNE